MNGKQIISLVLGSTLSGCSPQVPLSNLPLHERLKALSERSEPQCHTLIAMCYMVAEEPDRESYLCPKCGRKTVYVKKELFKQNMSRSREMSDGWSSPVFKVEDMREWMKAIIPLAKENGYDLRLDETGLCAQCGKGKKENFTLVAVNSDGKETRTEGITRDDCVYLASFFQGRDYYPSVRGGPGVMAASVFSDSSEGVEGSPLKEKAGRIAELLGLKLD